ncbi:AI-2E family transporter [Daejeonella lutea]|uniref:Predicted PurR-regulated permease PerM n=1 Tax=Daejeonella lutea TaxID=572036 RepID=A0A1T5EY23_9SPHI|nr:AI-2E family transporter [Daejeonella lutea]SKB88801.1 Predicted PurR-regulated permease PerM [Daejeonella lutea]
MFTTSPSLSKSISILFFAFLVISGLYFGREFLIPIAIATLLAMLFLPLCRWFENKGMNRAVASLLCILTLLVGIAGIVALLSWQASDITNDLSQIGERISKISSEIKQYIAKNMGISPERQKAWLDKQSSSGGASMGTATTVLSSIMGILVDTVLVLVYLFLFISSRAHLKKFVLMIVPNSEAKEANQIMDDAGKMAQKYLSGMSLMIVSLWVLYGIGFTVAGVENALFFAVLCGILEIIPFVGNLAGTSLTLLMVVSQGGDDKMIFSVLATYLIVQFLQTYILEPLVVGSEVNINPMFTIFALVLFELIWGIPGMILAIPMIGILKIICDHVKPLKPYGYLIGKEKNSDPKIFLTIKNWFGHSKSKKAKS